MLDKTPSVTQVFLRLAFFLTISRGVNNRPETLIPLAGIETEAWRETAHFVDPWPIIAANGGVPAKDPCIIS